MTINKDNNSVWVFVGAGRWTQWPGQMRDIAVVGASRIYGIGLDAQVYRFDGTQWTFIGNGNNVTIGAASDGSVLVVNRNTGNVWRKVGDNTAEAWSMIPNSVGTAIAAPNAQRAILIGRDAKIYLW